MGSCFFIGHRETPDRVYPTLLETIERHITEYGVSEFVVGRYGNFDRLVIWALSQAKRAHPDITLMLMTPYYPVNRKVDLPEAFDALFYPPDLETVPKRLAIVRANRYSRCFIFRRITMNRVLRIDEEKPEMHISVQGYKVTLCFAEKENPEVAVLVKQALLSAYAMPQK